MKTIVHVTEALGGGVCSLLSNIAKLQARSYRVILIYSLRGSSPSDRELKRLFPEPIELVYLSMTTNISLMNDVYSLMGLISILKKINPDVIHLHSSKAGVLGRVAARISSMSDRVFYSPHGLSFLRRDISLGMRYLYQLLEWFFSKIGGITIASSKSEEKIIRRNIGSENVKCIENGIDLMSIKRSKGSGNHQVRIITTGRITYAKAPWTFKEIVLAVKNNRANFFWFGGGELQDAVFPSDQKIPNLSITGWVENGQLVLDELEKSDIFLLTSLWEGMPISLLEAQAAGLPAVVSNVVGARDVVLNGETGYVCDTVDEMIEKIQILIDNDNLRMKMGGAASDRASEFFSIDTMHAKLLQVYGI